MSGGVKLGTVTLCKTCNHAIQLRRVRWKGGGAFHSEWVELDMWEHMEPPSVTGAWHETTPTKWAFPC